MFRDIAVQSGCVVLLLFQMRRHLSRRGVQVSKRIKLRHYIFISFLVFVSFTGLGQTLRMLRLLTTAELVADLARNFIALRELSPGLSAVIWGYCVFGRCATLILAVGMAYSNGGCRRLFLRLFPFLVLADFVATAITVRGADGLRFARITSNEYFVIFLMWLVFAWPYLFVYRFYRSTACESLFARC